MNKDLFLVIQTNSYVGNFERELMAYVFGYDSDGFAEDMVKLFEKDIGDRFYMEEFLDYTAFGRYDSEYTCYKISQHPLIENGECDSIYVCLNRPLPDDVFNMVLGRLDDFCASYNKEYHQNVKILDLSYYQNVFTKVDPKEIQLGQ